MVDGTEQTDEGVKTDRDEIYSKSVRAGKRTYFFDVKTTRRNDYYLTLTESKKRFNRDGKFYFEKHKIFLYKEDFEKFIDGLNEVVDYIKVNAPELLDPSEIEGLVSSDETKNEELPLSSEVVETNEPDNSVAEEKKGEPIIENFSNVEFEDLEDSR